MPRMTLATSPSLSLNEGYKWTSQDDSVCNHSDNEVLHCGAGSETYLPCDFTQITSFLYTWSPMDLESRSPG